MDEPTKAKRLVGQAETIMQLRTENTQLRSDLKDRADLCESLREQRDARVTVKEHTQLRDEHRRLQRLLDDIINWTQEDDHEGKYTDAQDDVKRHIDRGDYQ